VGGLFQVQGTRGSVVNPLSVSVIVMNKYRRLNPTHGSGWFAQVRPTKKRYRIRGRMHLSHSGPKLQDQIKLIYTETPYGFDDNFEIITHYADELIASATRKGGHNWSS
jgi:hypothetical protein